MKKINFFLAIGAVALIIAGCQLFQAPGGSNTNTTGNQDQDVLAADEKEVVNLQTQNNSGQSGTATLTAMDGQTKVVLSVSGGPAEIAQPAHIHNKNCADIGGVLYPLTSVINGDSETILNVPLDTILSQLPLSINVHKSAQEASVYVACGDIGAEAMMPAEDESVSGGENDVAIKDDPAADNSTTEDNDAMAEPDNSAVNPETKTFAIDAVNFAFSETEIRVKKGDKVKIVLKSVSGFHNWTIDEFNAATAMINTGQTASVEFVADKAGTFEYYCAVGNHRQMGMVGRLIVE